MKRGFITLSNGIITSILLAGLGWMFTSVSATTSKIETNAREFRDVDTTQNTDIATLKADVKVLKENSAYTRDKVDLILTAVSKK